MGNTVLGSDRPLAGFAEHVDGVVALKILTCCEWRQRGAAACLSREWRAAIGLPPSPHAAPARVAEAGDGMDAASGRDGVFAVSKDGSSGTYWHLLCERLAEEHQVYVPLRVPPCSSPTDITAVVSRPPRGVADSWEKLFRELFPLCQSRGASHAEGDSEDETEAEVFNLGVAARFRPARASATDTPPDAHAVVLPLHQRVQLVKEQFGISSKEAVAMVMQQHARRNSAATDRNTRRSSAALSDGWVFQELNDHDNKENVDAEAAPLVFREGIGKCSGISRSAGDCQAVASPEASGDERDETPEDSAEVHCSILAVRDDAGSVLAVTRQSGLRDFRFDRVFGEMAPQEDVYELSTRRLVVEFLNGRSSGVICYGQTGSGKTFTMFAPPATCSDAASEARLRGIVPRACDEILGALSAWRRRGLDVRLGVSYVEIFGSEVSDLLQAGRVVGQARDGRYDAVRATDRVGHRYVLDGHTECFVDSWDEVERLLWIGDEAKRRAATAMNERSTRAHSILILSLSVPGDGGAPPRQSRFYFADLGGSEQVSKSKADAGTMAPVTVVGGVEQSRISWQEYYRNRQRIQETVHINKGLFALKRVIETLHRRSSLAAEGVPVERLPYVPYQDSKLTMMLQEALGGAARTLIITTATMDPEHTTESLQSLRFAETCAGVRKRGDVDKAASVRLALGQLEQEIVQVEAEIRRKERWETRRVMRSDVDTVAGAFGESHGTYTREEVVHKSVLVGAEAERERLEWLLQRRRELEGLNGAAGLGKHYQEMNAKQTRDGGLGADWRERDRFQARMKARDFEDEGVIADALRFLFRKSERAREVFGETERSAVTRLPRAKIPAGYFRIARSLRKLWEDATAEGLESRSLGKAMLDRCQAWSKEIKAQPDSKSTILQALLDECGHILEAADWSPMPHELDQQASAPVNASAEVADEF